MAEENDDAAANNAFVLMKEPAKERVLRRAIVQIVVFSQLRAKRIAEFSMLVDTVTVADIVIAVQSTC